MLPGWVVPDRYMSGPLLVRPDEGAFEADGMLVLSEPVDMLGPPDWVEPVPFIPWLDVDEPIPVLPLPVAASTVAGEPASNAASAVAA